MVDWRNDTINYINHFMKFLDSKDAAQLIEHIDKKHLSFSFLKLQKILYKMDQLYTYFS